MLQVMAAVCLTVSSQPPGLSNGHPQRTREPERLQATCLLRGLGGLRRGTACPELIATATRAERKGNEKAMQIQQPAFVSSNHEL